MKQKAQQQQNAAAPKTVDYDKGMYITGWCLLGLLVPFLLVWHLADIPLGSSMYACVLHSLTGLYCPGCGGTRAILFLLRGDLIRSLLYHPLVPYAAFLCGWFMISQTIQRVSRSRIRIGMHYRDIYLWIALFLLIANVVIKNLLLIWHIDLLLL